MSEELGFLSDNENEEGEVQDLLKRVTALAQKLVDTRHDISLLETQKKDLEKLEKKLSQEEIPSLLLQQGLTSIELEGGVTISVREDIFVTIPKDPEKQKEAFTWLIQNGGLGMIKEQTIIEEPEKEIIDFLKERRVPFEQNKTVHAMTLKSFFKSKLGITKGSLQEIEIGDVPKCLNLFIYKKTKIS